MPLTAAALLVGLAGCGWLAPPDQDPEQNPSPEEGRSASDADATAGATDSAAGPIELASPIELLLVEEVGDAPCPEGFVAAREGEECFRLGDGMEITAVEVLETDHAVGANGAETGELVVNLTMTPQDGSGFADLTSQALSTDSQRIAMVVQDEVVAAPQVAQQIQGGELQISGWDGAEDFVAEATGG